MATKGTTSGQEPAHDAYPPILPPAPANADPAPLLETLARVALAIARRRAQRQSNAESTEQAAPEDQA